MAGSPADYMPMSDITSDNTTLQSQNGRRFTVVSSCKSSVDDQIKLGVKKLCFNDSEINDTMQSVDSLYGSRGPSADNSIVSCEMSYLSTPDMNSTMYSMDGQVRSTGWVHKSREHSDVVSKSREGNQVCFSIPPSSTHANPGVNSNRCGMYTGVTTPRNPGVIHEFPILTPPSPFIEGHANKTASSDRKYSCAFRDYFGVCSPKHSDLSDSGRESFISCCTECNRDCMEFTPTLSAAQWRDHVYESIDSPAKKLDYENIEEYEDMRKDENFVEFSSVEQCYASIIDVKNTPPRPQPPALPPRNGTVVAKSPKRMTPDRRTDTSIVKKSLKYGPQLKPGDLIERGTFHSYTVADVLENYKNLLVDVPEDDLPGMHADKENYVRINGKLKCTSANKVVNRTLNTDDVKCANSSVDKTIVYKDTTRNSRCCQDITEKRVTNNTTIMTSEPRAPGLRYTTGVTTTKDCSNHVINVSRKRLTIVHQQATTTRKNLANNTSKLSQSVSHSSTLSRSTRPLSNSPLSQNSRTLLWNKSEMSAIMV